LLQRDVSMLLQCQKENVTEQHCWKCKPKSLKDLECICLQKT
jgi:hypothetical protein